MRVAMDRGVWLQPNHGKCDRSDCMPERPLRLILLGAPGVGKGTQAELITKKFKACQLSTGDVIRAAKSTEAENLSPAMGDAVAAMKQGLLVDDQTIVNIVRERSICLNCGYGFILDGFPRTVDQAEQLDGILRNLNLELDAVLNFTLPTEQVIERLSGRRTCRNCKTTFHIQFDQPEIEGVCDKCNGELFQRDDDQPDAIKVRLREYETNTAPLVNYYHQQNLLLNISAKGSPQVVHQRCVEELSALLG